MAEFETAIAGAGIAGLTAALLLSRSGRQVSVFERTAVHYEVGAGLQISPNAGRILEQLGLGPALDAVSVRPQAIDVYSGSHLKPLVSMPLASAALRLGAPYRVLHRADLQRLLLDAARADPSIRLALAAPITDVETLSGAISFSIGGTRHAAKLLVGADGIRSAVRHFVDPGQTEIAAQRTAWRTTIPAVEAPEELPRDHVSVFMNERSHVVAYPIRAGKEINVVAIIEEDWSGEGWAEPGDPDEITRFFRNASSVLTALINAGKAWTRWCLRAVEPSGPWHRGHAVLVGDSAHAMLPFLAQGAAMAIEDAAILTRCLAQPGFDTQAALQRYQALRQPRVARVWRAAQQNGTIYHMSPLAASFRDATMKALGGERLLARYDWLYGWKQNG
ncbi:monooxygenase [Kaistia algarum]|uniref:FAD-dependent monooxygenase n=1 Tax=Kaistia algarum TaxID=2083279 RepID=UPI000CE7D7D2|nr:FAD-dependent monooxygenase [Kaistia algarum]MCX5516128.1 FAD-dependent monooxygenase [Kaistia algarum]PPE78203.1 monooxygenase [Kaistia algarum]